MLTASAGGTYHVYGEELAKILTRTLRMPVAERTTGGPNENIAAVEDNPAVIGFVTTGAALQAWNGTADWTHGKQYRSLRALFPMYDTPFHFVATKASGIRSIRDMAGKKIGVGPEGGTAGTYMPKLLKALGIDAALEYDDWDVLAKELGAGQLDALAVAVGPPFPAIAALEAQKKIVFIAPSAEDIRAWRLAFPELTLSVVPAGLYPSLTKGYKTVGLYNFAVANQDMPDDLAYAIVDAAFANRAQLVQAHPAAAATVAANYVNNTFLPYHPGALRYYATRIMGEKTVGD